MLTRRGLIAGAGALGLAACVGGPRLDLAAPIPHVQSFPSLKELGASRGVLIGSAFSGNADTKYRSLLQHHCALITPEWQLKPRYLRAHKASPYNFGPSDRIAAFATDNQMEFHGHTLFWHEEPIRWAESENFAETTRHYGGFIRDVVSRYPQASSWDVFNEIVDDKAMFRNEFLIQKFGLKFIEYCLHVVNEMAPEAALVINDYNLECAANWCGSKQENMLALLRSIRKAGIPLHAVGIQSHLSSVHRASTTSTLAFIDRVADLGFDVFISELDVNDSALPEEIAVRDRQVAEYYETFLNAVLSREAVKRVNFWGISDFDNWIVRRYTTEKRAPGTGAARPALFDEHNEPKPAFHAVVRALRNAPERVA